MGSQKTIVSHQRTIMVACAFLALYGLALAHLFILQIIKNPFFAKIGQHQYQITLTQTPARAPLFDRHGNHLALNKQSLSAFIVPNNIEEPDRLKHFLKNHFQQAYQRLISKPDAHFMFIKRHISNHELDLITHAKLDSDIHLIQEPRRFYPIQSLGTTIGFTDIDNKGLSGLELVFDKHLSGEASTFKLQKEARSNKFYFAKETTQAGVEGKPIKLTIDSTLQNIASEQLIEHCTALEAREGDVLIMDPASGDILAMACYPDFDPNEPIPEDLHTTKNRIFTEVQEFGSVMKVFTALAALDSGVVTIDEIIDCENKKETYFKGIKLTTWKAFGKLSYMDVIRKSNNIGTAKVALRLKPMILYDYLKRFGFGELTGLGLPGEQRGSVPHPRTWSVPTPMTISYGYGLNLSMLQLARGFAIIANSGLLVTPRLILEPPLNQKPAQRVIDQKTVELLRTILDLSDREHSATNAAIPGYTVLGKTGSAYLLTGHTYDHSRSMYTFCGIVGKNQYKRIIIVSLREPRPTGKPTYASTIAAPLFKSIAERMLVAEKVTRN